MSTRKGPLEKVHRRKSMGEGLWDKVHMSLQEKVHRRRSIGKGLLEKVHRRRSTGKGPSEKRDVDGRGPIGKRVVAGKVAKKVALIPCEEKNNPLIFIN